MSTIAVKEESVDSGKAVKDLKNEIELAKLNLEYKSIIGKTPEEIQREKESKLSFKLQKWASENVILSGTTFVCFIIIPIIIIGLLISNIGYDCNNLYPIDGLSEADALKKDKQKILKAYDNFVLDKKDDAIKSLTSTITLESLIANPETVLNSIQTSINVTNDQLKQFYELSNAKNAAIYELADLEKANIGIKC